MANLSGYCLGLMEAAWLAILVLVPVFFNRHSNKMFDPDKLALFRGLIWVMLAACVVQAAAPHVLRRMRSGILKQLSAPLMIPGLILAVIYLAATRFSVSPAMSWRGSYDTLQGTYTVLCYLVLGAMLAKYVRRWEQVERLMTVIVGGSVPVALYALVQRAGYDPVNFAREEGRVISTLGQPVYLGAYLGMVFPLTLWCIWRQVQRNRGRAGAQALPGLALGVYLLTALAQIVAILFTQSRGPLLGVAASLAFLSTALAAYWQKRRVLLGAFLVVLPLVVLLLLSLQSDSSKTSHSASWLGRYSSMFRSQEGTGLFRTDLWSHAPAALFRSSPFPFPEGGRDQYHRLRLLLGFGPETLASVLPQSYSSPGPDPRLENRFHNLAWDLLASIGAAGLLAFLAMLVLAFFYGYRRIGLLSSGADNAVFWPIVLGGAGVGVWALAGWNGVGYAGLGLQVGLICGLTLAPLISFLVKKVPNIRVPGEEQTSILLLVLLSVLAGHIIETSLAFEVGPTAILFWSCLGLSLALIGRGSTDAQWRASSADVSLAQDGSRAPTQKRRLQQLNPGANQPDGVAFSAIMATLTILPLLAGFIHVYSFRTLSTADILAISLTRFDGRPGTATLTIPLLLVAWSCAVIVFSADASHRRIGHYKFAPTAAALSISGLLLVSYGFFKAHQLSALGTFPTAEAPAWVALDECLGYEQIYLVFVAVILVLVLLNGFFCSPFTAELGLKFSRTQLAVGLVAAPAILVCLWKSNLNTVRADICLHWADAMQTQHARAASVLVYERAVALCPEVFLYHSRLAEALHDQGEAAPTAAAYQELMDKAIRTLSATQTFGTLNRAHFHLGELYTSWAAHETEPVKRLELARMAGLAFDRALIFEPQTESGWIASATVDELFLDRLAQATRKRGRAQELVREQDAGAFGDFYLARSALGQSSALQRSDGLQALAYFERALGNAVKNGQPCFSYQMAQARLLLSLGDLNRALACSLAAAQNAPSTNLWRAEELSARICFELKDKNAALVHVESAIRHAPDQAEAGLAKVKTDIQRAR